MKKFNPLTSIGELCMIFICFCIKGWKLYRDFFDFSLAFPILVTYIDCGVLIHARRRMQRNGAKFSTGAFAERVYLAARALVFCLFVCSVPQYVYLRESALCTHAPRRKRVNVCANNAVVMQQTHTRPLF